jgi:hypothetical protein
MNFLLYLVLELYDIDTKFVVYPDPTMTESLEYLENPSSALSTCEL